MAEAVEEPAITRSDGRNQGRLNTKTVPKKARRRKKTWGVSARKALNTEF